MSHENIFNSTVVILGLPGPVELYPAHSVHFIRWDRGQTNDQAINFNVHLVVLSQDVCVKLVKSFLRLNTHLHRA